MASPSSGSWAAPMGGFQTPSSNVWPCVSRKRTAATRWRSIRLMLRSPQVSRSCDLAHIQRRDFIIGKPELRQDAARMCAKLRRRPLRMRIAARQAKAGAHDSYLLFDARRMGKAFDETAI